MRDNDFNHDQQLIARLKVGDRQAFDQIYFEHVDALYRFAFNILKDNDECTDAVQEIFIWLWENKEKLEITDLRRYLSAAIKYRLSKAILRSKRRTEIISSGYKNLETVEDSELELKELKNAIQNFLETLPPRAREIFHLSRNEFLSNKEIASRMQISEKTVENQMTISLRKLRLILGRLSFWTVLF